MRLGKRKYYNKSKFFMPATENKMLVTSVNIIGPKKLQKAKDRI